MLNLLMQRGSSSHMAGLLGMYICPYCRTPCDDGRLRTGLVAAAPTFVSHGRCPSMQRHSLRPGLLLPKTLQTHSSHRTAAPYNNLTGSLPWSNPNSYRPTVYLHLIFISRRPNPTSSRCYRTGGRGWNSFAHHSLALRLLGASMDSGVRCLAGLKTHLPTAFLRPRLICWNPQWGSKPPEAHPSLISKQRRSAL